MYADKSKRVAPNEYKSVADEYANDEVKSSSAQEHSNIGSLSPPIQRFRKIDNTKYTQKVDTGPDARKPFTRNEEDISLKDKGTKATERGWKHHFDTLPPLHVANDNSLAINANDGEPKEFYCKS